MADTSTRETFQPGAGALAFLIPGLGHIALGEAKRGFMIMIGVFGLFIGGMLIGGIDVIDSREDRWWFVGQAFVGPAAFGVDWIHQNRLKAGDPPPTAGAEWFETNEPRRIKSLGHVNEIGSLYATIAGMLNAICIIDAGWHAPRRRRRHIRRAEDAA
ncbi:MAG: DUF6677 family protein [Planctomycetota bacterium]|nr:DUF6677 family protein [Planctomycetota bacterium]